MDIRLTGVKLDLVVNHKSLRKAFSDMQNVEPDAPSEYVWKIRMLGALSFLTRATPNSRCH